MVKTTDEKIDGLSLVVESQGKTIENLARVVEAGFKSLDEKVGTGLKSLEERIDKKIDEKIDELAAATQAGFEVVAKETAELRKEISDVRKTVSNFPDKAFVTDKFDEFKAEINVKLHRKDVKVDGLINILHDHKVLTNADVERLDREYQKQPNAT